MCEQFNKIARGELKRVIINMAPRHSKSEMSSYMLPSWLLGIRPDLKIIQATHTGELAVRFGRKVRDLVDTREYKEVFPNVSLRADSKAAGRWETTEGGEYFASGVGGAITGRGADILIIDDPHSEQDALSETAMEMAYEWYTSGPRQRLQPRHGHRRSVCILRDGVCDRGLLRRVHRPESDRSQNYECC